MTISIPELCLVVMVGPSGSGKSTFCRQHFRETEVLSSDRFRAMIADDEGDQSATFGAFELLHLTASKRLGRGRLTVIDATNLNADGRRPYIEMARRFHVPPIAIALNMPREVCDEHNRLRPERQVPERVIAKHAESMKQAVRRLESEGFRAVYSFETAEEARVVTIVRERLPVNRRELTGPFDIIGDVHGCMDELRELLVQLGYVLSEVVDSDSRPAIAVEPPSGRTLLFVGDLVDRGPDTPGVLRLVMRMVEAGTALCVRGNHDDKLFRKLSGRDVTVSHGLAESLTQFESEPPEFHVRAREFLSALSTHFVLDGGRLVIAHAGLKEHLHGRMSERVRAFTLYGETTGEVDEQGLPIRLNWAADYKGQAHVVYGHTPTPTAEWQNRTICLDTGCVFGGALTALRYPEMELLAVRAKKTYAESARFNDPGPMEGPEVAD